MDSGISRLREFVSLARDPCFSRVADSLHTTQPTLSRHIASLESELGVRLFERRGGAEVQLTDAGSTFLEACISIIRTYDAVRTEMKRSLARHPLSIRISGLFYMEPLGELVAKCFDQVRRENHDLRHTLVFPEQSASSLLQSRNVDIAFDCFGRGRDMSGLQSLSVCRWPLFIAVKADHRLAQSDSELSFAELDGLAVLIHEGPVFEGWQQAITDYCEDYDVRMVPHTKLAAPFESHVSDVVDEVAITTEWNSETYRASGFTVRGVRDCFFDMHMYWRSDNENPAVSLVTESMQRVLLSPGVSDAP